MAENMQPQNQVQVQQQPQQAPVQNNLPPLNPNQAQVQQPNQPVQNQQTQQQQLISQNVQQAGSTNTYRNAGILVVAGVISIILYIITRII